MQKVIDLNIYREFKAAEKVLMENKIEYNREMLLQDWELCEDINRIMEYLK